jgi:hypothetical protein
VVLRRSNPSATGSADGGVQTERGARNFGRGKEIMYSVKLCGGDANAAVRGRLQLAGEVKTRGERRRVRSDWMAVEGERGISVSSAVTSFEHEGVAFNLLDRTGRRRSHGILDRLRECLDARDIR